MSLFESIRRANIDFYTASPLEFLSQQQLEDLAQREGTTVEELREYLSQPHPEMTCPLCGRASTHLVGCKGCGGDAFGFDMEQVYGADATTNLRDALAVTLHAKGESQEVEWQEDQIHYAVEHAYQLGGCMICATCFHHTLPYDAFQTCPIYLHHERTLETTRSIPFQALLRALLNGEQARAWVARVFQHWCEIWNTGYSSAEEKQAIAAWRATILHGALDHPEEFLQRASDISAEIAGLLRAFGIAGESIEQDG